MILLILIALLICIFSITQSVSLSFLIIIPIALFAAALEIYK